jgi:glycine C-acetyltransferase
MTDRSAFLDHVTATLATIEAEGLMKRERLIAGPQGAHVTMAGRPMLNLCANNYLGLADDPRHGERALHLRHAGPAPAA